ncbi:PilL N-terminal domain-containing protein [Sweet potato little leaf phytoplasma]|uniref:PFGI-1 class ICE element type IV pilus protein PilL2 n=1 Tax=Candidatus Phytoplasma australasiaticum TaxID=2754999 RepID=UPI0030E9A517
MQRIPLIFSLLIALQGCSGVPAQLPAEANTEAVKPSVPSPKPDSDPGYVRSSRYTLISTTPKPEQLDLLLQIIDVQIPPSTSPSIQNALQHVLLRSGYRLCEATPSLLVLYSRPLPAAHYTLGPMPLKTALQVIAGPAWQLQTDALSRTICFEQHVEALP